MNRYFKVFNFENLATPTTGVAAWFGATVGPVIELFYGANREVFFFLLIALIVGDWICGIAAAVKDQTYSSEIGLAGLLRTIFILWFPVIGNLLDQTMNTPGIAFYAITTGLIYHTYNSMAANAYRAGWKRMVPKNLPQSIQSEIQAKIERSSKQKGGQT